jgi:hypothetical protein
MATQSMCSGTLYLHVGPHKTGSSAIQSVLAARDGTLAHHGKMLLRVAGDVNLSSLILSFPSVASSFEGHQSSAIAAALTEARDQLRGGGDVVASGEALSWLTREGYGALLRDLGNPRVRALFGLRPLGDLLRSVWAETIRSGGTVSYGDWLLEVDADDSERDRVLPGRKLEVLVHAIGAESVEVFHAPMPLEQPWGMHLLERWLGLASGALAEPLEAGQLDVRPSLSRDQLVSQVVFNHVFAAAPKDLSVASEMFARETQRQRHLVEAYLFRESDEGAAAFARLVDLDQLAMEQAKAGHVAGPSWLEGQSVPAGPGLAPSELGTPEGHVGVQLARDTHRPSAARDCG